MRTISSAIVELEQRKTMQIDWISLYSHLWCKELTRKTLNQIDTIERAIYRLRKKVQ